MKINKRLFQPKYSILLSCLVLFSVFACSNPSVDLQAYLLDPHNGLSQAVRINDKPYTLSYYPQLNAEKFSDTKDALIYFSLTQSEGKDLFEFSEIDFAQKTVEGDFIPAKIIVPVNYGSSLSRLLIGFDENQLSTSNQYIIRVGRPDSPQADQVIFSQSSIAQFNKKITNL
jgi:hypothetical protein